MLLVHMVKLVKARLYRSARTLADRQMRRQMYYDLLRKWGIRFVPIRLGNGNRMWIDLHDEVLGHYFFIHQEYEPFESSLFEQVIEPGMTVVDVGANVGYYTLLGASRAGPSGTVIAFEPDLTNIKLLQRNMQINRFSNSICEKAAVLGFEGMAMLYLSNNNFGDHRVFDACDDDILNKGVARKSVEVPAVSLDKYLKKSGFRADVVKIDIQGAEMLALPGMIETLSNPRVVLFCEFWPYGLRKADTSPKHFLESLKELGFELFEIIETSRSVTPVNISELSERFPDMGYANLFCIHPSRSREFLTTYLR